jgi:dephospho-CoA kinase
MTAVLVTGMSGRGKTSVLHELARRGHRVVDTDVGGWIVDQPLPDGGAEPLWTEHRIAALLDEPRDRPLFVAGCVANQGRFYDRFAAVVLLSAPQDVLLERIATRTTNDFGKRWEERARILDDLRTVEPLLRAGATAEVDTRRPLAEVADMLESIAASPAS